MEEVDWDFLFLDAGQFYNLASPFFFFTPSVVLFCYPSHLHDHNFQSKNYHILFLLPFRAEAFEMCKNTIKLINLCALPCLGLLNT